MYIKLSKKHMGICLLISCLFLTSYLSVFNTSDFSTANLCNVSAVDGENENSSMNGGAYSCHFSYESSADTSISYPFISIKQSRSQVVRINFGILTAITAAQLICLIFSSKLSYSFCTPFNSIRITTFLHKKDGMK